MLLAPKLHFPPGSVELVCPVITIDDVDATATADYDLAVTAAGAQPTTWQAPTTAGPRRGYLTGTLTAGTTWDLWIRVNDSPERPIQIFARLEIG